MSTTAGMTAENKRSGDIFSTMEDFRDCVDARRDGEEFKLWRELVSFVRKLMIFDVDLQHRSTENRWW